MMKRTGVPRMGLDDPGSMQSQNTLQMQQPGGSNMHVLAQSAQPQILVSSCVGGAALLTSASGAVGGAGGGAFGRAAPRPASPHVINYLKSGVQYAAHKQPPPQPARIKEETMFRQQPLVATPPQPVVSGPSPVGPGPVAVGPAPQFQRLKVEDALSYLDQVKFKFNTQPQVYNDFLDIMKEFKSQTIDTPGVITRVSNLFKGHPALIVGFNTFLPPGYKIEVQSDGQVSVSMPSPTGLGAAGSVLLGVHHTPPQPQLVHLLPVAQSVSTAIVHKLSAPPPANTLHHISTAHRQIENSNVHHVQGTVQPPPASHAPASGGQPVEFNHAIEYVNKIKSRFSRQPDKYKRFLEILHAYQRTHRDVKEKHHTEQEVYSQVAKLFENQDDLLAEFGQFLPDAKGVGKPSPAGTPPLDHVQSQCNSLQQHIEAEQERYAAITPVETVQEHPQQAPGPELASCLPVRVPIPLKRSPSFSSGTHLSGAPPAKRARSALSGARVRDVSYAEAAKLATLHDYTLFDRVRKALRYHHVYDNFLRCLLLYTNEIISGSELLSVTQPFLVRQPELQRALRRLLRAPSPVAQPDLGFNSASNAFGTSSSSNVPYDRDKRFEAIGPLGAQLRHDRPQGDVAMDIDLNTCKRLGASYVALPREAAARKCSGRTQLCKEVLNDTWVSFPTWSEDSTFVTSRKTQYEEYIYRCEDERFELDVVIETNASTIRVLEGIQKKLSRMNADDAASYRLDDCLGGQSATIHQRALRRIYGDKAVDIIAGLKKNPVVAVPVVLRRLKAKEEEWRDAQKGFNKQWREQNEKYYLKSLDHQGINFKQNDLKAMRSKSLFNEVESAYAAGKPGPHLVVDYNTHSRQEAIKILQDTAELLIHHARRQTAIQKAEKRRIKQLLRHFLPDLFGHPRQPLSDDERDEEDKESPVSEASEGDPARDDSIKQEKHESSESDNASEKSSRNNKNDKENKPKNHNTDSCKENSLSNSVKRSSSNEEVPIKNEFKSDMDLDDDYRDYPSNEARFVCSSSWYVFFRVHACIAQRLCAARRHAAAPPSAPPLAQPVSNNLPLDVRSPSEYYSALLELVRGVLDGNVEPASYEDAAREMFGIKAYPVYTLDKLVSIAVRQLQHCVSEPWSVRCTELAARGMRGPLAYARRAARALRPDHTAFSLHVYGGDTCRVTFQLLESSSSASHTHAHKPARPPVAAYNKPVFLRRNVSIELPASDNAATAPAAAPRPAQRKSSVAPFSGHSRRTPAPPPLYRRGALAAARAAQPALSRLRSARFQAWLAAARRQR